uniref:Synaptobrevin, longin-like domain protein n=1 Tax=Tanacetum cinerariifolium TaxID=118510 RepID=A0A699IRG7_TANCI|nr:hypothetical protein [Tanacetum cinerariifolium]
MVDFVEASPLMYALTFKPTVYVSHIRQFWSTVRIETTEEGTKILATVDGILITVTESSFRRNLKLQDEEGISSLPDRELFKNLTLMGYKISPNQKFTFQKGQFSHQWKRTRIAQSSVLLPVADKPASSLRDVSQREACSTDSGFLANQDRATIAKSSTLPHDSAPRVTSHAAAEGTQELEITRLKARVKLLEDREGVTAEGSGDDAPIKGRNLDEGEAAAKRVSDDTKEMAIVLTSMDAATVLASGAAKVSTGSGSIPTVGPPAAEVPTGSDIVPTASPVFAIATVVTPYRRRKGKEVMIAKDVEVARIHVEEELQSVIDGLDRSNETVAKYLQEYQQFALELPLERRIELISDLVRYQDNYANVHKFQTQQRKPWSNKQKRDYYMAVIRSNLGWKDEILKRKGLSLVQKSAKKFKPSDEVPEEVKSPDEVPKEKIKEMMQLVPIEEIIRLGGSSASYQFFVDLLKHMDKEDLKQLWALVKESLSNRTPTIEWKLYDMCRVHQVTSKDKEIFMLVEKDYPIRKGLALMMINYKLQVENYSQMENDLILKIYKIANSPRQQGD